MGEPTRLRIGGRALVLPPGEHEVGRMADCWLTLDDDLVSRYHARFHVGLEGTDVEDLNSRNGTYVNGVKISGRVRLAPGDEVAIGRERIEILGAPGREVPEEVEDNLRRTMGPGEETQFPSLIGQLVEKSLKVGKVKEAERYAAALTNQLMAARVGRDHPTAVSCVRCLVAIAEKTASGVWIDRVFKLHASQGWVIDAEILTRIQGALDRIPRIPGTGLSEYEQFLRQLTREGSSVPAQILRAVAELRDTYAGG